MSELKNIRKNARSNKNFILFEKSVDILPIITEHKSLLKEILVEVYASAYMDGEASNE